MNYTIFTFWIIFPFLLWPTIGTGQTDNKTTSFFHGGNSMSSLWQLDEKHQSKTFTITPYRPIYFVFARYSDNINENPVSVNRNNAPSQPFEFDNIETSFQLSFKTKVLHDFLWNSADLWVAYTQEAYYQLYNKSISRPMRELNYEPEVILNFKTNFDVLGFKARMFGLSINHESNGLDRPLSRSWNRIIFHAGFEKDDWQVYVRPWIYVPRSENNNPEIEDFIGRGELRIIRDLGKHRLKLIGKHSLNPANSKGSIRLDYTFPIINSFNGYLRVFRGYGESLVDYNHKQTTIGLGISLID